MSPKPPQPTPKPWCRATRWPARKFRLIPAGIVPALASGHPKTSPAQERLAPSSKANRCSELRRWKMGRTIQAGTPAAQTSEPENGPAAKVTEQGTTTSTHPGMGHPSPEKRHHPWGW